MKCNKLFALQVVMSLLIGCNLLHVNLFDVGQSRYFRLSEEDIISKNSKELSYSKHSVVCGNPGRTYEECFKGIPIKLLQALESSNLAESLDELFDKCNVFNHGLSCFDDYANECLTGDTMVAYQSSVQGARTFFKKLCDDPDVQLEYLLHKDCLIDIKEDWNRCRNDFQNILNEQINTPSNITLKFLEFCCARHSFENCIYISASRKCAADSSEFARKAASILSTEKFFKSCQEYGKAICESPSNASSSDSCLMPCLFLINLLIIFLLCYVWIGNIIAFFTGRGI